MNLSHNDGHESFRHAAHEIQQLIQADDALGCRRQNPLRCDLPGWKEAP